MSLRWTYYCLCLPLETLVLGLCLKHCEELTFGGLRNPGHGVLLWQLRIISRPTAKLPLKKLVTCTQYKHLTTHRGGFEPSNWPFIIRSIFFDLVSFLRLSLWHKYDPLQVADCTKGTLIVESLLRNDPGRQGISSRHLPTSLEDRVLLKRLLVIVWG